MCRNFIFASFVGLCLVAVILSDPAVKDVEQRLKELETRIESLERENKEKNVELMKQQKENKEIMEAMKTMEKQFLSCCESKENSDSVPDAPEGETNDYPVNNPYLHNPVTFIAFYALTHRTQKLSNNEVIEFKSVKYNKGLDYSSATSKFTCPDNGVYAFFVTLMSAGQKRNTYIRWKIVRNGYQLTAGHTGYGSVHNMLMPHWGSAVTGSQMVIANCYQGRKIWVQTWFLTDEANHMETFSRYCSFAGYKLA